MDPLTLILLVLAVVFLFPRFFVSVGSGSPYGGGNGGTYTPAQPVAPSNAPNLGFQTAAAVGSTGLQAASSVAASLGSTAASAIPIVGAAFSAVLNSLMAASAQRKAQATNENAAVGRAVPGWDAAVQQIVAGYNGGSLSAPQVQTLLAQLMANYFAEVGPVIQPGRNGCQSGGISKADADARFPGLRQCSGDWGAACCVGYADLWNGVNNMAYAVTQAENTGKATPAVIPAVYASKYGGVNRPAYTVTFQAPTFKVGF